MKKVTMLFAAILLTAFTALAGQPYTAVKGSKITVAGTSTMHDWKMVSEDLKVQASLPAEGQIEELELTVPVATLKSGKGGMDDNAYKALKAREFPMISFQLKEAQTLSASNVEAVGQLTIAGVSREIKATGKIETLAGGDVKITGTYKLNMTDYKVEPPSFMFGSVSTGEEVTITYELILSR